MDKVISDSGSSKGKPSGGKNSQGINLVDRIKAAHARRAATNSEGGTKGEVSNPKESEENNKVGTPETTDSEDTTETPKSDKLKKKIEASIITLGNGQVGKTSLIIRFIEKT